MHNCKLLATVLLLLAPNSCGLWALLGTAASCLLLLVAAWPRVRADCQQHTAHRTLFFRSIVARVPGHMLMTAGDLLQKGIKYLTGKALKCVGRQRPASGSTQDL